MVLCGILCNFNFIFCNLFNLCILNSPQGPPRPNKYEEYPYFSQSYELPLSVMYARLLPFNYSIISYCNLIIVFCHGTCICYDLLVDAFL